MKLTNWKIIVETFKYFISWVTIFYFAYVYLCSSVYIYAYDTLLCADICGVMHFKVNSWCKVLCHFPPYLQNPGLSLEPWFCRFCWLYVIWSSYTRDPPHPRLYLPGTGIVDKLLCPHDIFVDTANSTSFLNASWKAIYTLGHFHIPFLMKNLITWSV